MYLEYFFTHKDPFLTEIWPFSQGVSRCATKWKKRGRKVIFGLFFANLKKTEAYNKKVGKWVLRESHNISKNVYFP